MGQSKEEKKVQKDLMDHWGPQGFRCVKTHEMLSSGKPDLRVGHVDYSQLDVELKHKTTTDKGIVTGVSKIQWLTMKEMNEAGMPAVALVFDDHNKDFFITLEMEDDRRELPSWRIIDAVLKGRVHYVCDPFSVYYEAKRLLNAYGYPSAKFLNV